jgi:hypothetical protein
VVVDAMKRNISTNKKIICANNKTIDFFATYIFKDQTRLNLPKGQIYPVSIVGGC